jgi:tetratricopeptide (TPR) repeat protein
MADFKYHVFLSHSSTDKPAVEELAVRLRREGIEPWLDMWNLIPGQTWQPAIEDALAGSATCAVFIGSGGFGAWQNEEMRAAINRRVADSGCQFRVIPVLLPMAERPDRGKLPTFLTATTWVEFRKSLGDEEAFRRLTCGIRGVEPGVGTLGAAFEGKCPYRGLEVFDVEHAPFFFGREALTEWMVDTLRPRSDGRENRFLAILSASGGGKSSLARGGLIAALRHGALEGSAAWPLVILKPGRDPIESLAVALAGLDGTKPSPVAVQALMSSLRSEENTLHLTTRLALRDAPPAARLVVLVDQCEEVFTLCDEEKARKPFFDNLLYAATVSDGRTIVLLTMRADFYGKCAPYAALSAAMSGDQLLVGPMTEDELRRAIERPALLAGGEFEPGLVEVLLQDVAGQPGSLPLLQFTLMELWQRRDGRRLTVAAYKALGELQGALKNRADDVLGQFDEAHREICRRIFLRLTHPGEGSEDTKRRASFGELVPAGTNPLAVEAVIRRLADARLITTQGEAKAGGPASVEVAHEALIRGWTQLRQWIDADRDGLKVQRQITEAALAWAAHGREGSYLFAGSRLAVASEWARSHRDGCDELEAEFLSASLRRRFLGKFALAASIFLVAASALAAWEWQRGQETTRFKHLSSVVDKAVEEARHLADDSNWAAAINRLEGAEDQLEPERGGEFKALHRLVDNGLDSYRKKEKERLVQELEQKSQDRDRKCIAALDEAQLPVTDIVEERDRLSKRKTALDAYRRAFRDCEIDLDSLSPAKAAERILAKPYKIRERLAQAIDDWECCADETDQPRLRAIARAADPDPYRNAVRDAISNHDLKTLQDRAHDPELARQPASLLNRLAIAINMEGDHEEATNVWQKAQFLHPHDFWVTKNLGRHLFWRNPPRWDEAIHYCSLAVALRPESATAHRDLGFALAQRGRSNEAQRSIQSALALDPTDPRAYEARSNAWRVVRKYGDAIADISKAIELDPSHYFYKSRGDANHDRGDDDSAIRDFSKAIELNPKWSGSYLSRGISLTAKGKLPDAIADLREAIKLDPKYPFNYNALGVALTRARDYDEAIANYTKAIEVFPQFGMFYRNRGLASATKGHLDHAIDDYGHAIKLDGKDTAAYLSRGAALSKKGDLDGAIYDYGRVIELDPKSAGAHFDRGNAWLAKGELGNAINDYDKAIALNPKFTAAYSTRANARTEIHVLDGAIADCNEAIAINPGFAGAYNNRANAWLAKKEIEKAGNDYAKAIALDPRYASAHSGRGHVERLSRQYDRALTDYDKAIAFDQRYAPPYNGRAWIWATCPDPKYRDGKKAVESATRACELTSWKNASFIDTLAAACAEAGDFASAVKWEEKALGLPPRGEPRRNALDSRMALFEIKKPYRDEIIPERNKENPGPATRP